MTSWVVNTIRLMIHFIKIGEGSKSCQFLVIYMTNFKMYFVSFIGFYSKSANLERKKKNSGKHVQCLFMSLL